MRITEIRTTPRLQAPNPGGPTAAPLISTDASDQIAVIHVEIPAGGGMPEHDHGTSQIVFIPLSGSIELRHNNQSRALSAGTAAHIATGERVSLANPGPEPAYLMVIASPPQFAERLATWPAA